MFIQLRQKSQQFPLNILQLFAWLFIVSYYVSNKEIRLFNYCMQTFKMGYLK